jgi:OOP family OmpA-OmpF porin
MIEKPCVAALMLTALQLGVAPAAAADENGLQIGVGTGGSRFETGDFDVDVTADGVPVVFTTRDLDDSDTVFYGSIGYRFSLHFAAEAEYMDLGGVVFVTSGPVPGSSSDVLAVRIESSVQGYAASAVGIMPLSDRWELFGRVGVLFSEAQTTVRAFGSSLEGSERSETTMLGIGGALSLRERWALRFDYRDIGDDVSAVTLGFVFRRGR